MALLEKFAGDFKVVLQVVVEGNGNIIEHILSIAFQDYKIEFG